MTFKEYLAGRCQKIAAKIASERTLTKAEEVAWYAMTRPTLSGATNVYALLDYFEEQDYEDAVLVGASRLWRAYDKARARAATPRITYNHSTMVSPEVRADLRAQGYAVMHRGNGRYWAIKRDVTMDAKALALFAAHASKKIAAD